MMAKDILIALPGLAALTLMIAWAAVGFGWGSVLVAAVALPPATCAQLAFAVAALRVELRSW